ncbi:semaphorin-7A [Alligator sinensis]|uniref:Semaphorin-7A n=1 Tax=Alligator sinensis TaxID=38654 RepID=A0A1U7RWM1_ALLSI|nr:semaphorin-7A [Alligator sinensis]
MSASSPAVFAFTLWTSYLWLLAAGHSRVNPRLIVPFQGEKRFSYEKNETQTVFYHEDGHPALLVGGKDKLYYFDFENSGNYTEDFFPGKPSEHCDDQANYLTFIDKVNDGILVCGTNSCQPTCWHWENHQKSFAGDGRGLAPFTPSQNALVLVDGTDIYSTHKKHLYNGKIPRFRRARGSGELYTSDTAMQNPQFIKGTVIQRDTPYDGKIYYFFREDNPDKSPEAPLLVSRVAQLCKGDRGGSGSLSSSKWTTFLKSTLACVDPATKGNFNSLQDIFIVPSEETWKETRVYGLFTNSWGDSAVCIYSIGEIDRVFQTSKLKGYNEPLPSFRPGQCSSERTPSETFRIADGYPEVEDKVQPINQKKAPLFHNKYHYKKIGVHEVQAVNGETYNVLYLVTDKGYIHKMVEMPHGVLNIMEIQPFQNRVPVQSMTLDHIRAKLYLGSDTEVVQVPMDMCEMYGNSCDECVLARDPYCGWRAGKCTSVYGNWSLLQNLSTESSQEVCPSYKKQEGDSRESYHNVTVAVFSRYYLRCPVESHYATYKWFHNDHCVQTCNTTHRPCIHFIENVTQDQYGCYICVSEEGGYTQTLVKECMVKQPEFMRLQWNRATTTSCCSLMLLMVFVLLFFLRD